MSKKHHPKQVAKVQKFLNGGRNSTSITAFPKEAEHLEEKFPIKLRITGSIPEVEGLYRFKVTKA